MAIYDDRLEITSPGGLMPGVTIDKMKEGYSKIRNRALAHAFSYMNLIEEWGSGIPKLMKAMCEYGLREPEFLDMDIALRINLYRSTEAVNIKIKEDIGDTTQTATQALLNTTQDTKNTTQVAQSTTQAPQVKLTKEYISVLDVIKEQPDITQREIAEKLCWKIDRVKYYLSKLKRQNAVRRVGTSQKGYWELLIEENVWKK